MTAFPSITKRDTLLEHEPVDDDAMMVIIIITCSSKVKNMTHSYHKFTHNLTAMDVDDDVSIITFIFYQTQSYCTGVYETNTATTEVGSMHE